MINVKPEMMALARLYYWERNSPNRIAMTQPMGGGVIQTFTWGQIGDQVRRMAAHLKAQGWEPGDRVAIFSKNCVWWILSDLAIWMAGFVSVPLYPTLAHDTIEHILTHSEARACFVGKLDDWAKMKPGVPAGLPCISFPVSPPDAIAYCEAWEAIVERTAPMAGEVKRAADELATLIYTSGTTGQPKGVMHSFGNFAWGLDSGLRRIPMTSDDRMLSYLPLAHVVERMLVEHGWLRNAFHIYFADTVSTFTADMQRARPTIFFSVPRLWLKFQQGVQHKLPQARLERLLAIPFVGTLVRRKVLKALGLNLCHLAAGGAAPMPMALLGWYRKLGLPINEGYGLTENLAVSHLTIPGLNQEGSVGPGYDGVETRIDAQTGEIQMRNGAMMLGYYKQPELTKEAFAEDGWLRTGDRGCIDAQDCLHITGRIKDLFKTSKGKYVAPAPIEDKLTMHEAIEACAVVGANLSQPLGIVLLNADAIEGIKNEAVKARLETSLIEHLEHVNATLDPHEQLECLVMVTEPWTAENDMITPTFKIKRNRIEDRFAANYVRWEAMRRKIIWPAP
jgi:long-chain acyl-CoA synthetase